MAPRSSQSLLLLSAILALAACANANGLVRRGRNATEECPPDVESAMVHTPFTPYFHWPIFQGDIQKCWVAADCLLEAAGESRKQQFGATALVMGLIPLTLKDIAWPQRRTIHVTKTLNPFTELLVLALGSVPKKTGNIYETKSKSGLNNMMARAAFRASNLTKLMWITLSSILLLALYAGLAIMEIYSKRSALGCVYPAFVASWYIIALLPAVIHASFAAFRRSRARKRTQKQTTGAYSVGGYDVADRERSEQCNDGDSHTESAVQGADEELPVQLAWAIYYIAGTLVFTSIMAVTVVELLCWVLLGMAIALSSKVLAVAICLFHEKTVE